MSLSSARSKKANLSSVVYNGTCFLFCLFFPIFSLNGQVLDINFSETSSLELLENNYGLNKVIYGKLDITFFRDDFRRFDKTLSPSSSEMEVIIEGKSVVIIDDVLYTGRSIRAALTALDNYGRPKDIQLLVLIDRRFSRDLPIQPDYTGAQVDALEGDKVRVQWKEQSKEDTVFIENK